MTKTILIPVSSNFFARNFLRSEAFTLLQKNVSVRIVLLTDESKVAYYKREFNFPNVLVDAVPKVRESLVEKIFQFVEQSSIVTNRTRIDHQTALWRMSGEGRGKTTQFLSRLPTFIMRKTFRLFGRFGSPWRNFIRLVYSVFSSRDFAEIFEKYNPDLAFAPTLVFAEDYSMLREAKRRGVRTVGFVFSWDTFFSKTFLRVFPDRLLAQTSKIKEQAVKFADYDEKKVEITGIVQYDRYFKKQAVLKRGDFFKKIGGDPCKKLILYAFSGKAGLKIDSDVVDILHSAISNGEIQEKTEVLLRPYPRFDFSQEKLQKMKDRYGFLGESSTTEIGAGKSEWEMNDEALSLLTNSLAHADIVISMYSTFFVEAAIWDKPLIAIAFDGHQKYNYWNSARRFFDWDHLKLLKAIGGIKLVKSKKEFVDSINSYLKNPALDKEGRRKIVEEQCEYTDGFSGRRVAEALKNFLCK
ncbi:MAG: CDP-glycerol glycerophosphotransferase family protein [bacterium]|nr:CDP-glycerol glycerophosphotransferase family protein [bacterium]